MRLWGERESPAGRTLAGKAKVYPGSRGGQVVAEYVLMLIGLLLVVGLFVVDPGDGKTLGIRMVEAFEQNLLMSSLILNLPF